ncbi:ferrous iron transport protein A [Candidatus Micrarchaeota archaeon]|nr:ferrous iron transport protein A [Candidatus Micrarchaeota archaeon]MBD3417610.1 ferrous iron transport protein A [Candidatus Micrarchaeota archaeon]
MPRISLRSLNERESGVIVKINAEPPLRRHLTELGFDPGSVVTVINKGASDLMVIQIKGCCRVAIDTGMASEIIVEKMKAGIPPVQGRGMRRRRRGCSER